jgi:hypothetical protein
MNIENRKSKIENNKVEKTPEQLMIKYSQLISGNQFLHTSYSLPFTKNLIPRISYLLLLTFISSLISSGCHVYSFKDVTIPPEVKTIKIGFIENKARYVNPQISPRLTDRIQQKINNQTRLTRTTNDDAHYQVSGYISQYDVTTSGISSQQAATNRLTVSVQITFKNTLTNTSQEFQVSRNFDFSANLSLQQAEGSLSEEILRNLTDEIFNRLFSNW